VAVRFSKGALLLGVRFLIILKQLFYQINASASFSGGKQKVRMFGVGLETNEHFFH
jgi:hypothetical protein